MATNNNSDDEQKNKCPLCGNAMEEPEECQHCDFKRREHTNGELFIKI